MLTIELNNQRLQQTLHQLEDAIGDLTPLMQAIAAELASQTEENFEHEGRPEWPELSDVTTERRARQGHWPGRMLQVSAGGLAASIVTHATDSSAVVGSNKPYAAMTQTVENGQIFRTYGATFLHADTCPWMLTAVWNLRRRKSFSIKYWFI